MSASTIGAIAGTVVLPGFGTMIGYMAGSAQEGADEARKARQAQERLEAQRRKELADEAAAREAAAAKAATSGQRVGSSMRSSFLSTLGFGASNRSTVGLGQGTLFGN